MRLTRLTSLSLVDPTGPVQFAGARGERLQITVLEEDLIRVQCFPDGHPRLDRTWIVVGADGDVPREGRPRDDLSPFSCPAFTLEPGEAGVQIRTARLACTINLHDGSLRWADADGRTFAADLGGRAYAYDRASTAIFHRMERRPGEHYYGFGERSGPLDKAGRRMRMLNLDALGYDAEHGDPLYKHVPFYITFIPELQIAYGLCYDNLATTVFDMGQEIDNYYPPYRTYQADDGDIDYYLIFGPTIQQVVETLSRLIGRMALPPRWSLGYLASAMTYTDAPDAQEQLRQFIARCAEHAIPCDLFHLSSGYTSGPDGIRYVFNWNRDKFPDPLAMVDAFHRAGINVAANIKPCLLTNHPRYAEVAALGGFIRNADTGEPEVSTFWGGPGSYLDFTNPAAYDWWKTQVRDQLLAFGIDATWNDNNEYEIWDDAAHCAGFGQPLPIGCIRPLHALLMARASREAQQAARPGARPFLISRSGCPGIQRYAQTWSGDNETSWRTLRYNIPMGLGLSLSGAPNTGHDVGGFAGPKPDPELFVRWVQNGALHPRFTIHSWNTDGSVNEPWMYPEVLPIIRDAISFRYRLIPYLYSLFFEAAHTGHPIIRPLVYAFPDDPRCHTESFDFMLGPSLLVASVLESGARTRAVYLPAGSHWCDFFTGQWHAGGQTITADAPLERIPLFVPAGGIIPVGKAMRYVGEQPDDLRQAYVFPHPHSGHGAFTLIEDDGSSLNYQRGEYTTVTLQVHATPDQIVLQAEVRGGFRLPYQAIEFILPPREARPARSAGPHTTWSDADGRQHLLLHLAGAGSQASVLTAAPAPSLHSSPAIQRHPANPILTAGDVPYPAKLVFNPGVAYYQGRYVMVFRNDYGPPGEQRLEGTSLGLAFSDDGVRWQVQPRPCFTWHEGDILRAYDPRLTVIDGRCYMSFAVDTRHGIRGGIAVTDDFEHFEILSLTTPDNRNLALFPERMNGRFMRLERPFPVYGRGGGERFDIWIAESPDLVFWGHPELLLGVEHVPFANLKIGPAAPPVRTRRGWLTLFHAVDYDPARGKNGWEERWQKRYTAGIMLLDLDDPRKVIGLARAPLLAPEAPYEVSGGFRNDVIFPGGMILEAGGEVKIYYGAADAVICLATAHVDDLIGLCAPR